MQTSGVKRELLCSMVAKNNNRKQVTTSSCSFFLVCLFVIRRTKKERSNVTVKTCDLVFTRLYHCNLAAYQVFEEMSKRKFNASCVASPLAWYQFLCCLQLGCVISFFNFIISLFHSAVLILEDIFWGEREKPRHQVTIPLTSLHLQDIHTDNRIYLSFSEFQVCCGYSLKKNDPLKILTLPYWCRITSFMELQMIQDYMYSAVANDTSVL